MVEKANQKRSDKKLNELRRERLRNGLSLASVALHYRAGCTRERIRAIESAKTTSSNVKRDYLAAITAAVADLKYKSDLLTRVNAELAKEKEEQKVSES